LKALDGVSVVELVGGDPAARPVLMDDLGQLSHPSKTGCLYTLQPSGSIVAVTAVPDLPAAGRADSKRLSTIQVNSNYWRRSPYYDWRVLDRVSIWHNIATPDTITFTVMNVSSISDEFTER